MNPIIIRALGMLPTLRVLLPRIKSYMATSGDAEQVDAASKLSDIVDEMPDDATLASIIRKAEVFKLGDRSNLLPILNSKRTVSELLAAWTFIQISATFGAAAAETFINNTDNTHIRSFLRRNREKLLSVTFEGYITGLTIFVNQIKPKAVNAKMSVAFTVLSQLSMAQAKIEISSGTTRMMTPQNMIKGVTDPNYFFSGKTKEEEENQGMFDSFMGAFDWLEGEVSGALSYASTWLSNEDISHTVNFAPMDNTANQYGFNPGSDEDVLATLDYLFFTVLKINLN